VTPALGILCAFASAAWAAPAIQLFVDHNEVKTDAAPFRRDDKLYLPVRATLEATGAQVDWDEAKRTLTVTVPGHTIVVFMDRTVVEVDGEQLETGAKPVSVNGAVYVPDGVLGRALPLRITFDPDAHTVEIVYTWERQRVALGDMIRWPRFYVGREIIVEGEYRGWQAKGLQGPVRHGPPHRRGDWIVKDGTGALYVSGARPKSADPVSDVGRQVRIEGVGGLAAKNDTKVPYVKATSVSMR
jgi:hypothetical protein